MKFEEKRIRDTKVPTHGNDKYVHENEGGPKEINEIDILELNELVKEDKKKPMPCKDNKE
jgi:hypothetical protein